MAAKPTKERRPSRVDPVLAGAAQLINAAAEAAKSAARSCQTQADAVSALTSSIESTAALHSGACATIASLIADKVALAEQLAAEKQKGVDSAQWECMAEEVRQQGATQRQRQEIMFKSVTALGLRALATAEPKQLAAGSSAAAEELRPIMLEILSKLSPETQGAIVADCGEELVQKLFALVIGEPAAEQAEKAEESDA